MKWNIPFLAIFLYDVDEIIFNNNFVDTDYIWMAEWFHLFHLHLINHTYFADEAFSMLIFFAMKYWPFEFITILVFSTFNHTNLFYGILLPPPSDILLQTFYIFCKNSKYINYFIVYFVRLYLYVYILIQITP